MPELTTASHCERCGKLVSLEPDDSDRSQGKLPRAIGKLKLPAVARGLRDFVLNDDPLPEALTQLRREVEGTTDAQQLEAFLGAFNFCMDCRTYVCTDCWNKDAHRCQTCEPLPRPVAYIPATFHERLSVLAEELPPAAVQPGVVAEEPFVLEAKAPSPEAQPVVMEPEPLVEPAPEPLVAAAAAATETPSLPVQPQVEPVLKPAVEPVLKPAVEPVLKPAVEPVLKPAVQPPVAPPPKPAPARPSAPPPKPVPILPSTPPPTPPPAVPSFVAPAQVSVPFVQAHATARAEGPNGATAPPGSGAMRGGQPTAFNACPSCGLPLSRGARFCRRCGTPQLQAAASP